MKEELVRTGGRWRQDAMPVAVHFEYGHANELSSYSAEYVDGVR